MERRSLPRGLLARIGDLPSNPFGLFEALVGYLAGAVLGVVALAIVDGAEHHPGRTTGLGPEASGLIGLWAGLSLALLIRHSPTNGEHRGLLARLRVDYGLEIRPLIDLPLGIVCGLGAQFLLVPLFELPLLPFVPHLFERLGSPARARTFGVGGPGLVLLGLLICVGSPLFEELYFRGLLLRGLRGITERRLHLRGSAGAALSILVSAVLFGLAHFEALQLLGLIGAGIVFGLLAAATRRLGAGIVAHAAFNTVAFLSVVHSH